MTRSASSKSLAYLPNFTARKVRAIPGGLPADVPDSLAAWATRYLALAVVGVRSEEVTKKIALHLDRFVSFSMESYGHDRISTCLRRDVLAWQKSLVEDGLAPATINNHLASLSAFTTWVAVQAPSVFPVGDPAKGVRELGLPPLEPRALTPAQVRSLKNLCDRLERFHQLKGQRWAGKASGAPVRAHGRPWRDRAIVYVFLSTGLRREELLNLDLDQLVPHTVAGLRQARQGRLTGRSGRPSGPERESRRRRRPRGSWSNGAHRQPERRRPVSGCPGTGRSLRRVGGRP
jgi:integrase